MIAQLPQAVQIARHRPIYMWRCPGGQGFAATVIQAIQEAATSMLSAAATFSERPPDPPVGSHEGHAQHEGGTALEETASPDLQE